MKDMANFEKFTGIYCSGLFIPDPTMLTSLCILSFSKKYRINLNSERLKNKCDHMVFEPIIDPNEMPPEKKDPLEGLTCEQKETVKAYILQSQHFFIQNHELLGNVIKSDMLPDNDPFEVELIKQGNPGELNTYEVREKKLQV